jgi:peptidoglycan glycosyltransferase
MSIYVQKMGLTSSYEFNGIESAEGSFTFDESDLNVAWAGIGQYEDQVNPLSMMVMVGAIAGNGSAAEPSIVKGESAGTVELIGADTALRLKELLRNNVITNYGDDNYPGLEMGAESGTAETGDGNPPHAWFTGYSGNYAFVVMVENGGSGADTAGPVANAVLQKINGQGE